MPVTLIPVGVPTTLVEDQPYALPTRQSTLFVQSTTATLEVSMTALTTDTWFPITLAEGAGFTAAPFVRTTDTGGAVIICKAQ
jgi:hypothetical protein